MKEDEVKLGISDNTDIENRPLSASSISTYLKCPMQWYFRYIEGKRIPPNGVMYLGTQWHKMAEDNYTQKVKTKKDRALNHMKEFFAASFDLGLKNTEVVFENGAKEKGELKDRGVIITGLYGTKISPTVQPLYIEEKFLIKVEGAHKELTGFWDVLDNKGYVRDNKSKSKCPGQNDVDNNLQLSIYSLAYRTIFKKKETGLTLDCAISTKVPYVEIMRTTRTNNDVADITRVILGVEKAVKTGIFYPKSDGWHCSEKWCGFWYLCKGRACGK